MTAQFKEIGEKYGPFDLAFIKIAAFNENWPDIHLTPEQAVEAAKMLRGKTAGPDPLGDLRSRPPQLA